ncbi:MAG: carboxymuconolactone decarboxylase [Robiginitomaculum sp.]|nr:MAG: carboxymuconolactone decarboxylase [Robiginitomaculum sp.]
MTDFKIHTYETAPEAAKPLLEKSAKAFGSVPNLMGVMAESPAVLQGYMDLSETLVKSSLAPAERHAVMLVVSVENQCRYCVAAHTGLARGAGLAADVIIGIREEDDIDDEKLEVLCEFTKSMVEKNGNVSPQEVTAFLEAGYTNANLLEVAAHIALKTLSNYVNHLAQTPVDASFVVNKWTPVD